MTVTHMTDSVIIHFRAGVRPSDGCATSVVTKPWRGRGSGDICSGCGDAITRAEPEVDIDVRGALTLAFHEECYRAWSTFPETL